MFSYNPQAVGHASPILIYLVFTILFRVCQEYGIPYPMGVGNTFSMGNNHSHVVFTYYILGNNGLKSVVFSNLVVYWQHPLLIWHFKSTVTGHTPPPMATGFSILIFLTFPYLVILDNSNDLFGCLGSW